MPVIVHNNFYTWRWGYKKEEKKKWRCWNFDDNDDNDDDDEFNNDGGDGDDTFGDGAAADGVWKSDYPYDKLAMVKTMMNVLESDPYVGDSVDTNDGSSVRSEC